MNELWKSVLGELELDPRITEMAFSVYLKDTKLLQIDDKLAIIGVKNSLTVNTIRKKYYDAIKQLLKKNGYNPARIDIEILKQSSNSKNIKRSVKVDDILPIQKKSHNTFNDGLNTKFTFENFAVGSSNDLAFAAAQNVANNPGKKYNPLYFYGPSGLGKTHLMQAIGNKIKEIHPNLQVLYTPVSDFYEDYLKQVKSRSQGFADKYKNVDVLIIDDIQFMIGKEKAQEQFFHTFNTLHQANKQIIISSDRAPQSLTTLDERIRSRFSSGFVVDFQLPDFETRQAIIELKLHHENLELSHDVIDYLAENIRTNIRELEGIINMISARAELQGIIPDLEMVEGLISHETQTGISRRTLNSKKIVDKVCKYYSVSKDDIYSKLRTKDVNHARQVASYLMKSELKMSFPEIGREFSRDHTSIMNGVRKIERLHKLDQAVREEIQAIEDILYS